MKEYSQSEDVQLRKRMILASQLNAILHEQLKDREASGGIITDKVIEQLARHIVHQKREQVVGLSNDERAYSSRFSFGQT